MDFLRHYTLLTVIFNLSISDKTHPTEPSPLQTNILNRSNLLNSFNLKGKQINNINLTVNKIKSKN